MSEHTKAKLIAAAPEMLKALEGIVCCTHVKLPHGIKAYCISDERMVAAHLAIKKAKGEQS